MGKTPRYFNRRRQAGRERQPLEWAWDSGCCPMGLKESFFFPLTPAKGQQSTKGGKHEETKLAFQTPSGNDIAVSQARYRFQESPKKWRRHTQRFPRRAIIWSKRDIAAAANFYCHSCPASPSNFFLSPNRHFPTQVRYIKYTEMAKVHNFCTLEGRRGEWDSLLLFCNLPKCLSVQRCITLKAREEKKIFIRQIAGPRKKIKIKFALHLIPGLFLLPPLLFLLFLLRFLSPSPLFPLRLLALFPKKTTLLKQIFL